MTKEIQLKADIALDPVTRLQAGALTCLYELGKLRYIGVAQTEILRMIYPAVRDEYWGTLPSTISSERVTIREDSFSIHYTASYSLGGSVYEAQYTIEGRSDSSIVFLMKGRALAAFKRNRIGLCVLHPVTDCSGQAVVITRPDGSVYEAVFPEQVAPQQPFHEIKEMHWRTGSNAEVKLFFEGDVFETEDQRNWTDNSYKTYSTPQSIPFPVLVQAGDTVMQQVRLVLEAPGYQQPSAAVSTEEKIAFPAIGYCRSMAQPRLTEEVVRCLQNIPFHHYRVVLAVDEPLLQQVLAAVWVEAAQLQTRVELVLLFSDAYMDELETLLPQLLAHATELFSILPLQKDTAVTPAGLLEYLYPRIKSLLPAVSIGYGTDAFFTALNRQRPGNQMFDFISFSCHPQVHAADSRTLLENLESLPGLISTAGHFAAGKPVYVSPLTLKDRYDQRGPDPRQFSQLLACWTLLSLQQLAMAGSITLFELLGGGGLLQMNPGNDNGSAGTIQPSPLYEMLVAIHSFQPGWIVKRYDGAALLMDGLMLENASGERLFFRLPEVYHSFRY